MNRKILLFGVLAFEKGDNDTLDVNYISMYNRQATRETLISWARSTTNPFSRIKPTELIYEKTVSDI